MGLVISKHADMVGWLLLDGFEPVQENDEYFDKMSGKWVKTLNHIPINGPYQYKQTVGKLYRRKDPNIFPCNPPTDLV